jgi:hypothetical protein
MPEIAAACSLGLGSKYLKDLVLISPRLAGATSAGASPSVARAIPRGRPPGIPNPRHRVPDLVARPLNALALSDLLDRKPHLLRPLAAQFLPAPALIDAAKRLGIDLASLQTVEDCRRVLATVLEAVMRGGMAPIDGARIAKRAGAQLRPSHAHTIGASATRPAADRVPTRWS